MTRARSHAEREAASEAVRELARGRGGKDSLAWELVQRHDVELGHVNRRLGTLEQSAAGIHDDLQEIKASQLQVTIGARQIAEKLDRLERARSTDAKDEIDNARYQRSVKSDLARHMLALICAVIAILSLTLNHCR